MTTPHRVISIIAVIAVAIAVSVSLSACGSSKPKFCSDLSSLQKSIRGISLSGGLSSVKSQLQEVKTETNQLISSAKTDFPQQTSDLRSALNRLKSSGRTAAASPSPTNLAAVASDGKALADAVNRLLADTKGKCS